MTYNDVVNNIGEFTCGVFNKSDENLGKTITVELIIWDPNNAETVYSIAKTSYTFAKPELPKANVDPVTPETVKVDGEDQTLEAEYKYTPVEPTEAQLAYYGNWYADYRISMDADTAAESFGLYGAYSGYGQDFAQGFLFPQALTANEPVNLLALAGVSGVTYNDVVNNIGEFTCGVWNESAENIGKTITVELIIWDPNNSEAEPAVIATTSYKFEGLTLELESQDTDGNTGVATLSGGGEDLVPGAEITVTAPAAGGFSFLGWYKDSYSAANLVSAEAEYTFTLTEDTKLIAVYQAVSTGMLHVKGNQYTVDDSALQTSSNDFDKPIGAKVTLTYTGEDFLYWVNFSGNIVSTSPTYNFVMVGETTIRLVTSRNLETQASVYVVFLNAYNQVLTAQRVMDAEGAEAAFPKSIPGKMGGTFEKWVFEGTTTEATPDSIAAKASATEDVVVKVVPLYTVSDEDVYTLNVKVRSGGTVTDVEGYTGLIYKAGKQKDIKVSVIAGIVGLNPEDFSFWSLDGGETAVSFNKTLLTVVAAKGQTVDLVLVFGEEKAEEPAVAVTQMYASQFVNDEGVTKYKVSATMRFYVPEGCTVQKSGFIVSTNEYYASHPDELVLGASNAKPHVSDIIGNEGIYSFNGNLSNPGKVVYLRAFISYTDPDGAVFTLYTEMYQGSYNSLTQ